MILSVKIEEERFWRDKAVNVWQSKTYDWDSFSKSP